MGFPTLCIAVWTMCTCLHANGNTQKNDDDYVYANSYFDLPHQINARTHHGVRRFLLRRECVEIPIHPQRVHSEAEQIRALHTVRRQAVYVCNRATV